MKNIPSVGGKLGQHYSYKISIRTDGFFEITQEKPGMGMIVLHYEDAANFAASILQHAETAKKKSKHH